MKKSYAVLLLLAVLIVLIMKIGCGKSENRELLKAKTLIQQKDYAKSALAVQTVLNSQPDDEEAISILETTKLISSKDALSASNSIRKILDSSIYPLEKKIKDIEAKGDLDEDESKELERLIQKRNSGLDLSLQAIEEVISASSQDKAWKSELLTNHIKLLVELALLGGKSPSPKTRIISNLIMSKLSKSVEPYLVEALKSSDSFIRQNAVEFLGDMKSAGAIQAISELLDVEKNFEVSYSIPIALVNIGGSEVVEPLIKCLKNEVAQTKIYAASMLGRMKIETAIESLILLLADDNGYVRAAASNALAQIGEPTVEPLIKIIETKAANFQLPITALISKELERNRRNSFRTEVIATLGKIRDRRAVSPLISSLNDKDVSSNVISALTSLDTMAVESLIEALKNSDETIRANAALVLGNIGDRRATIALMASLEDPAKEVSGNAAMALSKLRPKEAIAELTKSLKSDETTKLNAIIALGNIGTKDDKGVVELIKIASNRAERDNIRVEAIIALSKIKDNSAISPLIKLMLDNDEPDKVRQTSVYFLGEIKAAEAVEPMLTILESLMDDVEDFQRHIKTKYATLLALNAAWKSRYEKWTDVKPAPSLLRSESAISLGKVKKDSKDEKVISRLLEVLRADERASVRRSAVWALGEIKGDKVVEPLIKALKDDKRGVVRNEAAVALEKVKGEKVVDPLIEALLKDEYETTRKNAAIALREIKNKRAVEPLIKVLKNEHRKAEEKESDAVILAVMSCFDNDKIAKPAIQPLTELLKYPDPIVRSQAATALGDIQNASTTEALINSLSDENPAVRNASAIALGKIKDKKALSAQKGLINLVKSEKGYSKIRASAVEALGEMKDETTVSILVESLKDPSEEVRLKSSIALGKIKSKGAVMDLMRLLENKLESRLVKNSAIETLGEIGDPKAAPLIAEFINDPNDDMASKAIVAIGKLKYSEAVMPLIKALEDRTKKDTLRKSAAIALRDINDKRAAEPILRRLMDKTEYGITWQEFALTAGEFHLHEAAPALIERVQDIAEPDVVRYISALALGKTQAPAAFDVLKEVINDGVEIVRAYATSGLGETKSKEALDILVGIMENTGKAEIERVHAARGLGALGDPKAILSLIKAMNESNNDPVRLEATTSLGTLGGDQGVAALIKVLSDDSLALKFRRRAAEALGEAKEKSAISALEKTLKHQNAEIHFRSAMALHKITGNGYGYKFY